MIEVRIRWGDRIIWVLRLFKIEPNKPLTYLEYEDDVPLLDMEMK